MYLGGVKKLVAFGSFGFTQGIGAGNQVAIAYNLSGLILSASPLSRPLLFPTVRISSASMAGIARDVTIFGTAIGSISAWPSTLGPTAFSLGYALPPQPYGTIPANLFVFGAGNGNTTINGSYEIWGYGPAR